MTVDFKLKLLRETLFGICFLGETSQPTFGTRHCGFKSPVLGNVTSFLNLKEKAMDVTKLYRCTLCSVYPNQYTRTMASKISQVGKLQVILHHLQCAELINEGKKTK
uniref:Uncharacterized protein n=1 Tax=Daphnia magna TaxID=35525 RepID=A0A0P5SCV7_9CRUS